MTAFNFAMTTLLNGFWQGALFAAAVWIVLKQLPRVNPATRFTILWLTLGAVAILPVGPLMRIVPGSNSANAPAPVAADDTAAPTAFQPVELRQPELTASSNPESQSNSESLPGAKPAGAFVPQIPAAKIATAERSPIQIVLRKRCLDSQSYGAFSRCCCSRASAPATASCAN